MNCVGYTIEPIMVDLGGYVIILVETKEKKIKLYGKSDSGVCLAVKAQPNDCLLDKLILCVSFIVLLVTAAVMSCPGGFRRSVR
jgi:hypothetical protein